MSLPTGNPAARALRSCACRSSSSSRSCSVLRSWLSSRRRHYCPRRHLARRLRLHRCCPCRSPRASPCATRRHACVLLRPSSSQWSQPRTHARTSTYEHKGSDALTLLVFLSPYVSARLALASLERQEHACGAWHNAHPMSGDKSRMSSFGVLSDSNRCHAGAKAGPTQTAAAERDTVEAAER